MAGYLPTPLNTDSFSRVMAQSMDWRQYLENSSVFQAFFGQPEAPGSMTGFSPNSLAVDIDVVRANERPAATVPRGTESRFLGSQQSNLSNVKYTNISRTFPLIEEESSFTQKQMLERVPGEGAFEGRSQEERLRWFAFTTYQDHVRRILRTNEILASQSARTAIQDIIIGTADTDLQLDFRRNAANTQAAGAVWTNAATDILGDMDDAWDLGRENGLANIDGVLIGEDAVPGITTNTAIAARADNRRYFLVTIDQGLQLPPRFQRFIDGGATLIGRIITPKGHEMYLFSYSSIYNNAGTATKYMPVDEALFFDSTARCDRYFGPREWFDMSPPERSWFQSKFGFSMDGVPRPANIKAENRTVIPGAFYFDAYPTMDRKKITIRTQHAPIFAPQRQDAFVLYTGVA